MLTSTDRRALRRFIEQSVDHGFRLAIVEAISEDREAILAELAPSIGTGLLRIDVSSLPGADENLWLALQPQITASTRCLALWGIESRTAPDWPRQLNVQRDLFVRDLGVPWLLFIHPATRVRLLQSAPDFCDFAVLWVRADTAEHGEPPAPQWQHLLLTGIQQSPGFGQLQAVPKLLEGAVQALQKAEFAKMRDALSRFDLQGHHALIDRIRRQVLGARLELEQGHYELAEATLRDSEDLLRQLPPTAATAQVAWEVFYTQGHALSSSARYAQAEALFRRSLAAAEQGQGFLHPNYGNSLHALAMVFNAQGKYAEAEELHRRSLAVCEEVLGVEHPNYAASLHSLASVLVSQGKYAEGETLFRRSLAVREKALGVEHPQYGSSLHALAHLLYWQGKYAEAEAEFRRSLAVKKKALGLDHPDYAGSLQGLAHALAGQGKYAEAEAEFRRSLAVREKALGLEHPDYAGSLHGLAYALAQQEKYVEAETLLRRSLAVNEKSLGVEHPLVVRTLSDLAAVLRRQSKAADGLPLLQRAHTIATKVLGSLHPEVGQILSQLAQVQAVLKLPEAPQTAQQALTVLTQCLGPRHPRTQEARRLYEQLTSPPP